MHALFHDSEVAPENCNICKAIGLKNTPSTFEVPHNDKRFEVSLSKGQSAQDELNIVHVCHDITRRHTAEKNLHLISRLYNMLRLTNQAIFKHKEEQALLKELCEIATNTGQFELAWFGIVKDQQVIPLAYSDKNANYVQSIKVDLSNSDGFNGPITRALNSNAICKVNNTDTDAEFLPWREKAQQIGFKSVVSMPWGKNGAPTGVFTLYAAEADAFDENTLEMIENLSKDIGHIFNYIEAEKQRRLAEKQLTELSRALEQSRSAILITDFDLIIEYVNPYFCQLNGIEESELLGQLTHDVFEPLPETALILENAMEEVKQGKVWEGEFLVKKPNGETYWAYQNVVPVISSNGDMVQIIWSARDNSELRKAQKTISQLAFYDTLTELPNRRLFHDRMHKALQQSKRYGTQFALMFFDIDDFKTVNDTLGHDYGDLLLKRVAKVLKFCTRESDTVARLGGDEFCIILQNIESAEHIEEVASKIISALNKPTEIAERTMSIATSIGACVYPVDGNDANTLMKKADMAMYHAKGSGKNIYKQFNESIAQDQIQFAKMQAHIRTALIEDEFHLVYQPQFNVNNGELIGIEALIRWHHSELGWVSPDEFIPIAEQNNLITEIDQWVISHACREMKQLIDNGFPEVKLAINVSAVYFKYSQSLIHHIEKTLKDSGLSANFLQMEMTEGSLIEDATTAIETITAIKKLGVSLAIDDFGTGYSSLAYLQRFPIDLIKIDRSFMSNLENGNVDRTIVDTIINMAHNLGLSVLAEGVEHQHQLDYLNTQKCDFFQGYLYAKPMDSQKLIAFANR